jgi:hypothetical protein
MAETKKLGIWMDHASARLMEFPINSDETKTIDANFTHQEKEHDLAKGEYRMHTHEQHQQAEYYKKLGEVIKNYESVLLFGPTEAKSELVNILRKNHLFEKVKIEVKTVDKMTENQEHAFVKEYFSRR